MRWIRQGDSWHTGDGKYIIDTAHIRHGFDVEKERILLGPLGSDGGMGRKTLMRDAGAGAVMRLKRLAHEHEQELSDD